MSALDGWIDDLFLLSLEDLRASRVAMLKSYFDESKSDKTDGVLVVAGMVFDVPRARKLNRIWRDTLKEYGLEFFHMTGCANGAPPYDAIGRGGSDRLARCLIRSIRNHVDTNVAVSLKVDEFISAAWAISKETGIDWLYGFGGPYTFLAQSCLEAVGAWCREACPREIVTYYFEAGFAFEKEANRYLSLITSDPAHKGKIAEFHYYTHQFAPKKGPKGVRLLQAADILAWEWMRDRQQIEQRERTRPRRLSLAFLIHNRLKHVRHFRESELLAGFRRTAAAPENASKGPWRPLDPAAFDVAADSIRAELWGKDSGQPVAS